MAGVAPGGQLAEAEDQVVAVRADERHASFELGRADLQQPLAQPLFKRFPQVCG